MQVRVGICRQIVVDSKVDTLNVDTTAENVSGDTDTLVEFFELLVSADTVRCIRKGPKIIVRGWGINLPLLLADTRVNRDGREVTLAKQLVQLSSTDGALDEDDDLVELKFVQKLVELPVFLLLIQLDVVLLKTVQRQLGIFVNVVFCWVLHELAADGLDLIRQGGAEHHHLLLGGSRAEDLLNVTSHI